VDLLITTGENKMETLMIGLLLVGVMWYLGLFKTFQRMVNTGNRAASAFDNEHKVKVANRTAALEIDTEVMAKAQANKSLLDSFDL
jgi:hypothetical protein